MAILLRSSNLLPFLYHQIKLLPSNTVLTGGKLNQRHLTQAHNMISLDLEK